MWDPTILERIAPQPPNDFVVDERQKLHERLVEIVETRLTDREREVIELHCWGRWTFRQIANHQGCHVKNIWRCWKRALKKLEAELGPVFG